MSTRRKVLIVGGGVAGIELATRLGRARRHNAIDVTLVDRNLAHVWKPMLHAFATGMASVGRQEVGFLPHAAANGYRYLTGELVAFDRDARKAVLAPLPQRPERIEVGFDVVVFALGSLANDFGTPGVAEYCSRIDDLRDAAAFHARFRDALIEAHATNKPLHVAIVGGGATGVELAAEIKQAADRLARLRDNVAVTLTLIQTGDRILPHFPKAVSEAASRTLASLGVDVRTHTKVVSADETGFALDGGGRIEASLRVWAAGVRAPNVMKDLGVELSGTEQIEVNSHLRVASDPAIFGIGDCARCTDAKGDAVPATAQAAREQAIYLARHLDHALAGRSTPPFRYDNKGSIVSLGDYNGWGTLGRYQFGGGKLRGLSARAAHALLYRQHQFEVLGFWHGLAAWAADKLDRVGGAELRR